MIKDLKHCKDRFSLAVFLEGRLRPTLNPMSMSTQLIPVFFLFHSAAAMRE